ncbi:alpha/beta fold hydrolase [Pleionea sediminis]|uniref:alpha/beta fold hydrolase n=1 Tax=Pleionea sediminis TaxID=2569479 RepID=UPI00197B1332|nr:alpha/beta hydrolase [Pleionea sediminis]
MRQLKQIAIIVLSIMYSYVWANNQIHKSAPIQNEVNINFQPTHGNPVKAYQGYLNVQENRSDPLSRLIKIRYVRFPATGTKQGPPIIYLSGGPGGSGIATAKGKRFPLFMAMREFGDVIALDQRGTGESDKAPKCISSEELNLTQAISVESITQRYRKAATECFAFWRKKGFDVTGYTTVQNALDIDALRKHLGAKRVVLWGISYGSHLALTAAQLFADKIDKMILASAEGLDQTVKLPFQTDRYFERVQKMIDQSPNLKSAYPDLTALMNKVHAQLDANPIKVSIPNQKGAPVDLLFQKHHMQWLAAMTIADPGQYLMLLMQLYKMIEVGNTQMLTQVLQRGMFSDPRIKFELMPLAMDVASGITKQRLSTVKEQAKTALLGNLLNFPMPQLVNIYPDLDLGDTFRTPQKSNVPLLLFSGTLDGRTYPDSQRQAVQHHSNVSQILVENAGHNLFMSSPKVEEIIAQFMKNQPIDVQKIEVEELSF